MALSEKDVDLLLDTGSIVAKFQTGKELSPRDQELLSAGSKLFIHLAGNVDSLSRYKDIAEHVSGEGLDVFCKSVPPSILEDTANEVVRLIAEGKRIARIKKLHQELVDLLLYLYKNNPTFGWNDIPNRYQIDFKELAYLEKLNSGFDAYLMIRTEAGLPPKEEDKEKEAEKSTDEEEKPEEAKEELVTNNNQVIAANLAAYLADKEALESQVNTVFKDRLEKDRLLIRQMVEVMIAKKQAEILLARADEQTNQVIQEIGITDTKNSPLPAIDQTSQAIIGSSIVQTGIPFTPSQITDAVALFTTASVAGLVDLTNSTSISETVQLALAANPNYHTPATDAFREIERNFVQTTPANYTDTSRAQVTPDLAVELSQVHLPAAEIEPEKAVFIFSAPLLDKAETTQKIVQGFSAGVLTNPQTEIVMAHLNGNITQQQEKELAKILIATNLVTRIAPTQQGAAAATVIEKLNPVNPFVDAATIRVVSMGLDIKSVDKHLAQKPTSKLAQFFRQNPNVLHRLRAGSQHLENPKFDLGKEISSRIAREAQQAGTLPQNIPRPRAPGPLSGIAARYQSITNRLSGFLPGKTGQIFNVVTHPLQFIQGKIGSFIGRRIVGQFKEWLAKKVVSKIANEALKKAAGFVLKKGLQEGIKLLAKEGLKRGLQLLAQAANVAPGLGLVIAAAIEVGGWVLEKTVGLVKSTINGISQAMTGEDFDGKVLLTAPLAAVAGIGGILASLAGATAAAASSAAVVVIGSTLVGFFLYITVIAVAPIITTIAHLESGLLGVSGGTVENFVPEPGIECDGILPAENNDSASAVARKAYEITSGLKAGFWNYCNYHPGYPELFNFQLFAANPNPPYPGPIQNSAANLFWCTQLTAKAYGFAPGNSYSASGQMNAVNFQAIAGLRYSDVQSGDIVFINVGNSSRIANHVGVVYAVTEDAIVYLQSNAATKTANIPVSTDGTIEGVIGRIAILGFGKP